MRRQVHEVFVAGTAAAVVPVNKIGYEGQHLNVPCSAVSPTSLTCRLFNDITKIQVLLCPL